MLQSLDQAIHEAMTLQALIGEPVIDIECSSPNDCVVICYLKFEGAQWETVGFAKFPGYDRHMVEMQFTHALAYDACGVTIH